MSFAPSAGQEKWSVMSSVIINEISSRTHNDFQGFFWKPHPYFQPTDVLFIKQTLLYCQKLETKHI